jgi:hypothetical protein
LGDLHLTTELVNRFLEVINQVATAESLNEFDKDDVLLIYSSHQNSLKYDQYLLNLIEG